MNKHKDTPTSGFYALILKSDSSHRAATPTKGSHKHFGVYRKLCWDGYAQSVVNKHDKEAMGCISIGNRNMESFWFNVSLPLSAEKLLSLYLYVCSSKQNFQSNKWTVMENIQYGSTHSHVLVRPWIIFSLFGSGSGSDSATHSSP